MDIEVSKLKIMKADHNSKQFRLEDSLLKYFPEKIEEHKGFVRGLEADMQTLAAGGKGFPRYAGQPGNSCAGERDFIGGKL